MKIIITSTGETLQSEFDMRFGRSGWFCVFDTETKNTRFIENEHKDANGGAGTKAAELVAELEAKRVISGDFGPKAKTMLEKLQIQMIVLDEQNKTIAQIIDKIKI
jgi:predicted Fe-Mo cluster-binding NifX family protein